MSAQWPPGDNATVCAALQKLEDGQLLQLPRDKVQVEVLQVLCGGSSGKIPAFRSRGGRNGNINVAISMFPLYEQMSHLR
jgi:hypothetical protein